LRLMPSSYHDLQLFRRSPRAWAFKELGYKPYPKPGPMTIGTLAHKLIAAWFEHQEVDLEALCTREGATIDKAAGDRWTIQDSREMVKNEKAALALAQRYIASYAPEYEPLFIEGEFIHEGVVIHPDLVANKGGAFHIVDFKTTSRDPSPEEYVCSYQLDLYAFVLNALGYSDELQLEYHVLSNTGDKGIYAQVFRPNWKAATALVFQIQDELTIAPEYVLEHPKYLRHIERYNDYWPAERLLIEDGIEAAMDWLDVSMMKEEVHLGEERSILL